MSWRVGKCAEKQAVIADLQTSNTRQTAVINESHSSWRQSKRCVRECRFDTPHLQIIFHSRLVSTQRRIRGSQARCSLGHKILTATVMARRIRVQFSGFARSQIVKKLFHGFWAIWRDFCRDHMTMLMQTDMVVRVSHEERMQKREKTLHLQKKKKKKKRLSSMCLQQHRTGFSDCTCMVK